MNRITRWLATDSRSIAVIFALIMCGAAPGSVLAAQAQNPAACTAPQYRQFDFWKGDWDAFDVDNPTIVVARTRVTSLLNGCALLERYDGTNGTSGESFSIYDTSRKVWHQSWVTNRGQLLVIEGNVHAGAMILSGSFVAKDGVKTMIRGTWRPIAGGARESASTSTNGGETWTPLFDLLFRPHT
jgi:hypothetical protein